MGHDKLRKFAENETFSCLLQPSAQELLADGYFHLRDHAVKGHWNDFFSNCAAGSAVALQERATLGIVRGGPTKEDVRQGELQNRKHEKEIVLELGCGKGEYTIALAERDPERNYIGVDIKGARLWKGAKYATEHALPNVAFLRTRVEFITAFFAPGEVSEIWLTFSDPQYRSENSRLSSPLFLERYRSFLKPGGIVHLKTDSRFLHEYTRAVCEANGLRILACTTDLYGSADVELFGSSPRKTSGCAGPLPIENGGISPEPLTAINPFPTLTSQSPGAGRSTDVDLESGSTGGTAGPASIQPVVKEVQTFYEQLFLEQGYPITYLSFVIDHEGPYVSPRDPEQFDSKAWRAAEGPRLLFGHDSAETRRQKLHGACPPNPCDL
jgi:tRNA (guanine-N7-)-methyltransferase